MPTKERRSRTKERRSRFYWSLLGAMVGVVLTLLAVPKPPQQVQSATWNPVSEKFLSLRLPKSPAPSKAAIAQDRVTDVMEAIKHQESSGGVHLTNHSGSGAVGPYQITTIRVEEWQRRGWVSFDKEGILLNPALMYALVHRDLSRAYDQAIAQGLKGCDLARFLAASWYSSDGQHRHSTAPQFFNGDRYPSIAQYAEEVARKTDCRHWQT
ncbi:MAG: hypothetical protein VKK04_23410 [Synechococcales bacterium]|nr:hypothetical protein [Synechococcales bacterium]